MFATEATSQKHLNSAIKLFFLSREATKGFYKADTFDMNKSVTILNFFVFSVLI